MCGEKRMRDGMRRKVKGRKERRKEGWRGEKNKIMSLLGNVGSRKN